MDGPRDPFDDLADLFLTPESKPTPRPASTPGSAADRLSAITVAVAGHLPVSAGLWLAQLTDRLARDHGPTGLVRFVAGQVHVEVFRAGAPQDHGDPLDLHEALALATRLAPRWIVVPEASASSGEILRSGGGSLLLLTGADETAVVAAYRILKSLAEEAMVEGRALPPISVGVLGAGDVQVAAAMHKLNRTAEAFLAVELPLAVTMPRMEPLESSLRLMLPAPRNLPFEEVPTLLEQMLRERPTRSIEPRPAAPPPPTAREGSAPREATERREPTAATPSWPFDATPRPVERPEVETVGEQSGASIRPVPGGVQRLVAGRSVPWESLPGGPPARPATPSDPTRLPPAPDDGFMRTGDRRDPARAMLAERSPTAPLLARFEELRPMPVGCPYHPAVELGVDAEGRLHIVARLEDLADVEATAAWTSDHATLLRLACPGVRCSDPSDLVIDLVTARAKDAMSLLHSPIRLHLVAEVKVGAERGWLRLPLNDAAAAATPAGS